MTTSEHHAKLAYAAYGRVTDHKNVQGGAMPEWHELPPLNQQAWIAAAGAIWDLATHSR
jgi:hypothetical protein